MLEFVFVLITLEAFSLPSVRVLPMVPSNVASVSKKRAGIFSRLPPLVGICSGRKAFQSATGSLFRVCKALLLMAVRVVHIIDDRDSLFGRERRRRSLLCGMQKI